MNADRWRRLRTLFEAAVTGPPEAVESLLASVRDEDPEIYGELKSLLDRRPDEDFLESAPWTESVGFASTQSIGPYYLLREIGRGGMSVVFEALRTGHTPRQSVALKILRLPALNESERAQTARERELLAGLDHPHIARLLDWGETAHRYPYLVMEYIPDALTIERYCSLPGRSTADVLAIFLDICDAVAHAHQRQVIHCDLKPANLLVTGNGNVKLLDFGIARVLGSPHNSESVWLRRLTPAYASPEQILDRALTPASDIYSLGVLLFELLTGASPYRTDHGWPHEIVPAVIRGDRRKPSEIPGISPQRAAELQDGLEAILTGAMQTDPERRYASLADLSDPIRRFLRQR